MLEVGPLQVRARGATGRGGSLDTFAQNVVDVDPATRMRDCRSERSLRRDWPMSDVPSHPLPAQERQCASVTRSHIGQTPGSQVSAAPTASASP